MKRIRDWLTGLGWVKLVGYALLTLVAIIILWTIVYRLFFQGDDLAREHGQNVVSDELTNSTDHTTDAVINQVQARDVEQQQVRVIVTQGKDRVNEAWHGETVGKDVDTAGRDALCSVHNTADFCGRSAAPALQPVR